MFFYLSLLFACQDKSVVLSIEPSQPSDEEPATEPNSVPQPSDDSEPSDSQDTMDDTSQPVGPNDDSDGDGHTNGEEGYNGAGNHLDSDGDGIPNYLDEDSDNDGILDELELLSDSDGDGNGNYADPDSDDDGIEDGIEAILDADGNFLDSDGDGIPDYIDLDSDNDDIPDAIEGIPVDSTGQPTDTDADGTPDYRDTDADADSIPDEDEQLGDWDGDGIENYRDPINSGATPSLTLVSISTNFNSPIGIDYHEPSNSVVMSVNYSGGYPVNFELVDQAGIHSSFAPDISGMTDEVKIATVRRNNAGGFNSGELFVGNGNDGEIVRVEASGYPVHNPWVSLPGSGNGLMRGSLYLDDSGVFGGDLIAVTTNGEVWRIDSAGNMTSLVDLGVHLEGLITIPDAPARYGPLAGRILTGAEQQGVLYAIDANGNYDSYSLGVNVEDIDLIRLNENFFGVNFGSSQLLGTAHYEFISMVGDILLTQEGHSGSGLYWLHWDGSSLSTNELTLSSNSASASHWEHVTFAPAGIVEIAPVTP
jgi:hypothetical protein